MLISVKTWGYTFSVILICCPSKMKLNVNPFYSNLNSFNFYNNNCILMVTGFKNLSYFYSIRVFIKFYNRMIFKSAHPVSSVMHTLKLWVKLEWVYIRWCLKHNLLVAKKFLVLTKILSSLICFWTPIVCRAKTSANWNFDASGDGFPQDSGSRWWDIMSQESKSDIGYPDWSIHASVSLIDDDLTIIILARIMVVFF